MSEPTAIELEGGIRVVWDDPRAIRASISEEKPSAGWSMDGELGATISALRVLTGATEAGAVLLLASARPQDAEGHDVENPQAVILSASGEVTTIDEALVSTQYDAGGKVERVGLEFYAEDDDYPVRGAGDAQEARPVVKGPVPSAGRHEQTVLDFRLDGEAGTAILDVVYA